MKEGLGGREYLVPSQDMLAEPLHTSTGEGLDTFSKLGCSSYPSFSK